MERNRFGLGLFVCLIFFVAACAGAKGKVRPDEPVYLFSEFPVERLYSQTDEYAGKVFEGRFKFYRIYHDKETADLSKREQVIEGRTHFTARLVTQYMSMVKIRITPRQEKHLRKMGVERQDVIKARVRFAEVAPGGALAFDLLEIR
jgi:hypothetical protein